MFAADLKPHAAFVSSHQDEDFILKVQNRAVQRLPHTNIWAICACVSLRRHVASSGFPLLSWNCFPWLLPDWKRSSQISRFSRPRWWEPCFWTGKGFSEKLTYNGVHILHESSPKQLCCATLISWQFQWSLWILSCKAAFMLLFTSLFWKKSFPKQILLIGLEWLISGCSCSYLRAGSILIEASTHIWQLRFWIRSKSRQMPKASSRVKCARFSSLWRAFKFSTVEAEAIRC